MYCSSQRSSQGAHFDQMLLPFRETESPIWHESLGSVATQVHNMCEPFAFPPSIIPRALARLISGGTNQFSGQGNDLSDHLCIMPIPEPL
jgi:hypothetical protein